MPKHKPIPTDIGEYISYDPETGVLTWIKPVSKYSHITIGNEWGALRPDGYRVGSFRCVSYLVHRVIWFLQTGEDPGELMPDHLNGERSDNRWANLYLKDQSGQNRNRGALGFNWDKAKSRFGVWVSEGNGSKFLGYEDCPLLARMKYIDATREFFPEVSLLPRCDIPGNPVVLATGKPLPTQEMKALGYSVDSRLLRPLKVFHKRSLGGEVCPLLARDLYYRHAVQDIPDLPFVPSCAIKGNPTIIATGQPKSSYSNQVLGYYVRPEFKTPLMVKVNGQHLASTACPLLARLMYHDERVKTISHLPFVPDCEIKGNPHFAAAA